MKKLVLALVASTMIAGTASAAISTGFYVGGSIGYGNAKAKIGGGDNRAVNAAIAQSGNDAANIGIYGGYGFLSGCWYFGGEMFYTFENMKIRTTLDANNNVELKRNGYYGLALRAGYVFMHNTMFYVRAGAHMGKWSLNYNSTAANNSYSGNKNRISFAPGVGIETALNKNLYLRGEWFYEFGPSIRATYTGNVLPAGTYTTASNVRYNSFKLGLSYKF